jgi:hypothetical protein
MLIAAVTLAALRLLHVGVPLFVPGTRPGPFTLTSLDDVERHVGFAPLVPAYRPAVLGERPASITTWLGPRPTFAIVWQGDYFLSVTQRRGGPEPAHPPIGQPLAEVADSTWWQEGPRSHLILRRGEFWIEVETDLPAGELKRIADTLARY